MRIYSYDSELLAAGASQFVIANHWVFFRTRPRGGYDTSAIDPDVMATAIPRLNAPAGVPVLMDLEVFDLRNDREHAVDQLRIAADHWHVVEPTRKIGLYSQIPERSYWFPIRRVEGLATWDRSWELNEVDHAAWRARNTANARDLLPDLDFLCPSIYAFSPNADLRWRQYAVGMIDEALRVADGKPVYPILQPTYKLGEPIPLATWGMMLDLLAGMREIAGVFIQSLTSTPADPQWREVVKQHIEVSV